MPIPAERTYLTDKEIAAQMNFGVKTVETYRARLTATSAHNDGPGSQGRPIWPTGLPTAGADGPASIVRALPTHACHGADQARSRANAPFLDNPGLHPPPPRRDAQARPRISAHGRTKTHH
jgi:hypothetical protein